MLNANLITNQTGKEGRPCKNVLIQERLYARKEYYFAGILFYNEVMMDRSYGGPVLIGSSR